MRIKLLEETGSHGLEMKDFNLSAVHDSYEVAVKVIFAPGWPEASPSSFGSRILSDPIRVAHGIHKQARNLCVQGWAKEWTLGCVKSLRLRGQTESGGGNPET